MSHPLLALRVPCGALSGVQLCLPGSLAVGLGAGKKALTRSKVLWALRGRGFQGWGEGIPRNRKVGSSLAAISSGAPAPEERSTLARVALQPWVLLCFLPDQPPRPPVPWVLAAATF